MCVWILKEKEEEEPTSIFYQISCSFPFGLSLQPFLDLNLQYTTVTSHTLPRLNCALFLSVYKNMGTKICYFFFLSFMFGVRIYAYAKTKILLSMSENQAQRGLDCSCLTLSGGLYIHSPKGTHFYYFVGKW